MGKKEAKKNYLTSPPPCEKHCSSSSRKYHMTKSLKPMVTIKKKERATEFQSPKWQRMAGKKISSQNHTWSLPNNITFSTDFSLSSSFSIIIIITISMIKCSNINWRPTMKLKWHQVCSVLQLTSHFSNNTSLSTIFSLPFLLLSLFLFSWLSLFFSYCHC